MIDLDLSYNEYAICPYCGYQDIESSELSDDDMFTKCPECGKEYGYERNVEITYSTWALDKEIKGGNNE